MHNLVELKAISPRIVQDIVYATPNNFTGKAVYPSAKCYLIRSVAERLHRVQLFFEKKGLGLKIFDAYRPLSVQKILWSLVPDPRYVADPAIGSKHNRGAAVDVTLIDPKGDELPMPTILDDFSEKAHCHYMGCSPEAIRNRSLLQEGMQKEGFLLFPTEWWHFDAPDWTAYPVLDIQFDELK